MLIYHTPKDLNRYLVVNKNESSLLQKSGFIPIFSNETFHYYEMTEKLKSQYKKILRR